MDSKVKETKEALLAVVALGVKVKELLKDGAQLNDALVLGQLLLADGEFKALVASGYADADKIPAEVKAAGLPEYVELAMLIPQILELIAPKPVVA